MTAHLATLTPARPEPLDTPIARILAPGFTPTPITRLLTPGFVPPVAYADGLAQQMDVHAKVSSGAEPNTLILLEHEPVFTAGKRTSPDERPTDGTPVVDVDRGGKITWHGPGQLVGYPIVTLPDPVDVVAYVRRLEQLLIDALQAHGVHGERVDGRSGVWVRSPEGRFDKIGAIGIRVNNGVTRHGFALNCTNSLRPFEQIIPCGIRDAGVASILSHTGREISPRLVAETVAGLCGLDWPDPLADTSPSAQVSAVLA